jgi:RNA polymerase sigma-70 factor, ECF subfamily
MTATVQRTSTRPLPEGLERMFQEHHALVYRAAYRVTGNAQDAEDVLQTLFLRLLRRESILDLEPNPRGYLHRAAVNIALDIVRLRKCNVAPDESLPAGGGAADAVERREIVRVALATLSPKLAEIFILKHVEGYDNSEIAALVGTSRGAIAVMLFRARARLQKSIRSHMR